MIYARVRMRLDVHFVFDYLISDFEVILTKFNSWINKLYS